MQLKLTSAAKSRSARKPRNAFSKAEAAAPEAAAPEAEAAAAIASSGIAALAPLDSSVAPAIVPEAESATSEAPAATEADAAATLATRSERRALAAAIFHRLAANKSVPVKPLSDFAYKRELAGSHSVNASVRQAGALIVCLTASGLPLRDGTIAPRKFPLHGVTYAVENGCNADCVSVGLTSYDSASETITLLPGAEKRCRELLGNLIAEFAI